MCLYLLLPCFCLASFTLPRSIQGYKADDPEVEVTLLLQQSGAKLLLEGSQGGASGQVIGGRPQVG